MFADLLNSSYFALFLIVALGFMLGKIKIKGLSLDVSAVIFIAHEISMACDIRIASDNATFAQPETGLGIIPGFGGTQRLARLVGMGRAKEMIFTCDSVDAAEAYRIGLVNKVVAPEELMNTAKAMAKKIISKGSYAVSVAKAAINNGYDMDIKNAVEMEANLFGVTCSTHDKTEGMTAFLERRAADLTDF